MRILIQGDSHGKVSDIIPKLYTAGNHGIHHVVVAGDFGLWTHFADGQEFLDEVQEAARLNNLTVFAVGGNHENWDHWNWMVENLPTHKGFAMVRRRVLLAPKAHSWVWSGKKFVSAGGAVSVDKGYRLKEERKPKTLWWPNEVLSDDEVDKVKSYGKADYLITHDCSNYTPWKDRLKPDLDSQMHRQKIDEILKVASPKMHFHGHMHTKYDWVNDYSGSGARTIGLEAFRDRNSWGVLDLSEGAWYWPAEFNASIAARAERKRLHDEAARGSNR